MLTIALNSDHSIDPNIHPVDSHGLNKDISLQSYTYLALMTSLLLAQKSEISAALHTQPS